MIRGLTITELCEQSHALSKEKGWWEGKLDPADRSFVPEKLMLIVSEVSEALESYRKRERDIFFVCPRCDEAFEEPGAGGLCPCSGVCNAMLKPEGMAAELADVMIRIADLAARLEIDLEAAVAVKHRYNATRAHRHGRKAC